MKVLYVVIATKDTPIGIHKDDGLAHTPPRQLKQGAELLGVDIDYFPIPGGVSRWNYLKAAITLFIMSLRGDLDKYDLIHAHYGFHAVVARCQFRKPLVISLLGSDVYRWWERWIALTLIHFVDAVIVPGAQMRALINNYPADVIPYPTDFRIFVPMDQQAMRKKWNLPSNKKLVLFPYNPKRIYHKRPDIVEAAVQQIDDAELVVLYGKPSEVVAEYMNACDVLAMASTYEGSPVAVREALACNLPVVSVDVADVKDHIADVDGCYICERDPDDMAAKLRQVFADGKRLVDGRERVLPLGLRECAERNIEVYQRVLAKHAKK